MPTGSSCCGLRRTGEVTGCTRSPEWRRCCRLLVCCVRLPALHQDVAAVLLATTTPVDAARRRSQFFNPCRFICVMPPLLLLLCCVHLGSHLPWR